MRAGVQKGLGLSSAQRNTEGSWHIEVSLQGYSSWQY